MTDALQRCSLERFPLTRLDIRSRSSGLYDAAYEHDACGIAFVARLDGTASHESVGRALTALENLEHRGASGADADSGDGAGMVGAGARPPGCGGS